MVVPRSLFYLFFRCGLGSFRLCPAEYGAKELPDALGAVPMPGSVGVRLVVLDLSGSYEEVLSLSPLFVDSVLRLLWQAKNCWFFGLDSRPVFGYYVTWLSVLWRCGCFRLARLGFGFRVVSVRLVAYRLFGSTLGVTFSTDRE